MATQSPSIDGRVLTDMKVADLKLELEKRGLSKVGVKAELMKRLEKAICGEEPATPGEEGVDNSGPTSPTTPVSGKVTARKTIARRKAATKQEEVTDKEEEVEQTKSVESGEKISEEQTKVEEVQPVASEKILDPNELPSLVSNEPLSDSILVSPDDSIAQLEQDLDNDLETSSLNEPDFIVIESDHEDQEDPDEHDASHINEEGEHIKEDLPAVADGAVKESAEDGGAGEEAEPEDGDESGAMKSIDEYEKLTMDADADGVSGVDGPKEDNFEEQMKSGDEPLVSSEEQLESVKEKPLVCQEEVEEREEQASKENDSSGDLMETSKGDIVTDEELLAQEDDKVLQDKVELASGVDPTTNEEKSKEELAENGEQENVKVESGIEDSLMAGTEASADTSNVSDGTVGKFVSDETMETSDTQVDQDTSPSRPEVETKNETTDSVKEEKDSSDVKENEQTLVEEKKELTKSLWISGLSSVTRAADLKTKFSQFGKVLGAKVVTTARSPGIHCFGFVTMSSVEEATKCIENLNKTELCDRMVTVERAKTDPTPKKAAEKGKADRKPSEDKVLASSKALSKTSKPDVGSTSRKAEDKSKSATENKQDSRRDSRSRRSPARGSGRTDKKDAKSPGSSSRGKSRSSPARRRGGERSSLSSRNRQGRRSRSPRPRSPRRRSPPATSRDRGRGTSRGRRPRSRSRSGHRRHSDRTKRHSRSRSPRSGGRSHQTRSRLRRSQSPRRKSNERSSTENRSVSGSKAGASPARSASKGGSVGRDKRPTDTILKTKGDEKDKSGDGEEKSAKEALGDDAKTSLSEAAGDKKDTTKSPDESKSESEKRESTEKQDSRSDAKSTEEMEERDKKREEERRQREEKRRREKDKERELREERRRIQVQREYERRVRARREEERLRREREKERELEREKEREREREREKIMRERREREQRERAERERLERERLERERLERDRLQRERLERERLERERLERERVERERAERERIERERARLERERLERDTRVEIDKERSRLERERRLLEDRRPPLKRPGAPIEREASRRTGNAGYWEETKRLAMEEEYARDRDIRTVDSSRGRLEVSVRSRDDTSKRDLTSKSHRDEQLERGSLSGYRREGSPSYSGRARESFTSLNYAGGSRATDSYDRDLGRGYSSQQGEDYRRVVMSREGRISPRSALLTEVDREQTRSRDSGREGRVRDQERERAGGDTWNREKSSVERQYTRDPQKALSDVLERAGLSGIFGGGSSSRAAETDKGLWRESDNSGGRADFDERRAPSGDRRHGLSDRRQELDDRRTVLDDRRLGFDDRRGGYDDRRQDLDVRASVSERSSGLDDRRGALDDRRPVLEERLGGHEDRRGVSDRRTLLDDRRPVAEERRSVDEGRRHTFPDRRAGYEDRRPGISDRRTTDTGRTNTDSSRHSHSHNGSRREDTLAAFDTRHSDAGDKRERISHSDILQGSQGAWSEAGMSAKARELLSDANARMESQKNQFMDSVIESRSHASSYQPRDTQRFGIPPRHEIPQRQINVPDQPVIPAQDHWSRGVPSGMPISAPGRGMFSSVGPRPGIPARMDTIGMQPRPMQQHTRKF